MVGAGYELVDGLVPPCENRHDVIQRRDLPQLDPERLDLPPKPKVVEIRTDTYENAVGGEGLEVVVVLERLTLAQWKDFAWARPVREAIRAALEELGEERFAMIHFISQAEDRESRDEELEA